MAGDKEKVSRETFGRTEHKVVKKLHLLVPSLAKMGDQGIVLVDAIINGILLDLIPETNTLSTIDLGMGNILDYKLSFVEGRVVLYCESRSSSGGYNYYMFIEDFEDDGEKSSEGKNEKENFKFIKLRSFFSDCLPLFLGRGLIGRLHLGDVLAPFYQLEGEAKCSVGPCIRYLF